MLPQEPVMLLSFLNMKLRDSYESLEALSEDMEISPDELKEIINKLEKIGYFYSPDNNQFC